MPRELVNANITHVSYVDKGANKKQFFFTKSDKQPDFQKEVKVFVNKEEDEQQLVYGLVYEPSVEDSHGDYMTSGEIEKAAHVFMKDARNIDKQHDFNAGVGEVVESYIAPTDYEIGEQEITKGSWVMVTKATDEIWESIKKGDITGYSMAGTAETIEKEVKKKPVTKSHENDDEVKGFFDLMKSFFTGEKIQKGEVKEIYERDRKRREFWAANDALNSVIFNWNDYYYESEMEDDSDKIREALQDFVDIAQKVLTEDNIVKAVGESPRGDNSMKKEDIEKMLDEKLNPLTKRLDDIEKEDNGDGSGGGDPEPGKDDVMKRFSDVLDQKLSPITKRLDTVEKSRGVSKQADKDDAQTHETTEVQKGYMRHFGE